MSRKSIIVVDKKDFDAAESGQDIGVLANQLQINFTTAKHIIQRARDRDGIVSLSRGGANNTKIDKEMRNAVQEMRNAVQEMLDENCQISLKEMKVTLEERSVSYTHLTLPTTPYV